MQLDILAVGIVSFIQLELQVHASKKEETVDDEFSVRCHPDDPGKKRAGVACAHDDNLSHKWILYFFSRQAGGLAGEGDKGTVDKGVLRGQVVGIGRFEILDR